MVTNNYNTQTVSFWRRTFLCCSAFFTAFLYLPNSQQQALADYAVIATGKPSIAIIDLINNGLAGIVEVGAPTRAVVLDKNGQTAYVAAGTTLVSVQVSTRKVTGSLDLEQPIQALKTNVTGDKIVALTKSELVVLQIPSLRKMKSVRLKRKTSSIFALNPQGTQAAIVAGTKAALYVANLQKGTLKPVRLTTKQRKKGKPVSKRRLLQSVRGVDFENNTTLWASTSGKTAQLLPVSAQTKQVGSPITLAKKNYGKLSINRAKRMVTVGANTMFVKPLLVNLKSRTVAQSLPAPGASISATSFDNYYSYLLTPKRNELTLVSQANNVRTERIPLPAGSQPQDIAVSVVPSTQNGTPNDDVLLGSRYDNKLNGFEGNDTLYGALGEDTISGGPGNDTIDGGEDPDTVVGGEGDDNLSEGGGNGNVVGEAGNDTIDGGAGGDMIDGGEGNDTIDGGEHDDLLYGGEGDDRIIEKGLGNEPIIDGGPGNDYVDSGLGNDYNITGGEGNDTLFGNSGLEKIDGGPGDDTIDGGEGDDHLEGKEGKDFIRGSQNVDTISGGADNDTIDGGSGSDFLVGEEGNDTIIGGTGADTIDAGPGDDIIRVADQDTQVDPKLRRFTSELANPLPIESSKDSVNCGAGNDTVYTENIPTMQDQLTDCEKIIKSAPEASNEDPLPETTIIGVEGSDTLNGTAERDILLGADGDDVVNGNNGDDYVDGENGNDKVYGGLGDDAAQGRYGNDTIDGGDGNDVITGGYGNDKLFGGPGNDILNSGNDPDTIDAGPGDDQIIVANKRERKDIVNCGPGRDTVFADIVDKIDTASCEIIRYR